jgi:hypothetical protein
MDFRSGQSLKGISAPSTFTLQPIAKKNKDMRHPLVRWTFPAGAQPGELLMEGP